MIRRIVPLPGGTYTVVLKNSQEFKVSRIQSRIVREQLLRRSRRGAPDHCRPGDRDVGRAEGVDRSTRVRLDLVLQGAGRRRELDRERDVRAVDHDRLDHLEAHDVAAKLRLLDVPEGVDDRDFGEGGHAFRSSDWAAAVGRLIRRRPSDGTCVDIRILPRVGTRGPRRASERQGTRGRSRVTSARDRFRGERRPPASWKPERCRRDPQYRDRCCEIPQEHPATARISRDRRRCCPAPRVLDTPVRRHLSSACRRRSEEVRRFGIPDRLAGQPADRSDPVARECATCLRSTSASSMS